MSCELVPFNYRLKEKIQEILRPAFESKQREILQELQERNRDIKSVRPVIYRIYSGEYFMEAEVLEFTMRDGTVYSYLIYEANEYPVRDIPNILISDEDYEELARENRIPPPFRPEQEMDKVARIYDKFDIVYVCEEYY